jgi:hypothetical protein
MNNKTSIILPLVILLLTLSLFVNIRQLIRSRKDAARIAALGEATPGGQAKIITRYIHDSIEHVVIKEISVKSDAEKEIAIGSNYMDTLTKAIQVAANRIDEVTKVNAKLAAENITLKKSATGNKYEYQDKWLSLSYSTDSSLLNLSYDVSLNIAKYWKRNWFIAPKQYFVDLYSDDSRIKINSVKRYTLSVQSPKRLGVGLSAGYSYIPFLNKWQPSIGIGLNYNLIEF